MKKTFILLAIVFSTTLIYSQVGINTETPASNVQLDVNGKVIIRDVPLANDPTQSINTILVLEDNIVKHAPSSYIINSAPIAPTVFIRGRGTGSTIPLLNLPLFNGYSRIQFPAVDFDLSNNYNTSTFTFTAPKDGIYSIYLQATANAVLTVAGSFGVAIFKTPAAGGSDIIVAEQNINVTLGLVALTEPSSAVVTTLVNLKQNDKIYFSTKSAGISLGGVVSGAYHRTYFTVAQLK